MLAMKFGEFLLLSTRIILVIRYIISNVLNVTLKISKWVTEIRIYYFNLENRLNCTENK